MAEINEMDILDGIRLIGKAREQREEDRAFKMYVARYAMMDEKSYIPFDEFYNPKREPEDNKSAGEILLEVESTLNTQKGNWVERS